MPVDADDLDITDFSPYAVVTRGATDAATEPTTDLACAACGEATVRCNALPTTEPTIDGARDAASDRASARASARASVLATE